MIFRAALPTGEKGKRREIEEKVSLASDVAGNGRMEERKKERKEGGKKGRKKHEGTTRLKVGGREGAAVYTGAEGAKSEGGVARGFSIDNQ